MRKLDHVQRLHKMPSQSAMVCRLLQEALEKYPDPDEPSLL
jgi:hypothetical protein